MKKIVSLLLVFAMILSFAACAKKDDPKPAAAKIDQIVVGTSTKIEKAVRDEYAYDTLASGVSEMPLFAKNTDGSFAPLLASYSTEDSKTWVYTVKDGLKWSDGVDVTAEDIVFSLEYESETPVFTKGDTKGTYESYEISQDRKSVTLVLDKANVKALDGTVLRIRPKHIYEGKKIDQVSDADARISCGPYKFESFDSASGTLTFVRDENYPQMPNVEKVVYKIFANEDVMYQALMQGDLDYVWNYSQGVSANYQSVLAGASNVVLESVTASNCPAMLVFNNTNGLFSDKNLRMAVSYALDYNAFKTYFGSKYSRTPNRSFAPAALTGFKETEVLSTDLIKAAEYMKAAGYAKNGNYYEKDGAVAEFTLTVNGTKAAHVGYAEFVKTQLEIFGIKVNLDALDGTHYNERTSHKFAKEGEHAYGTITMEAAIMGYTAFGMSNLGGMYINGTHAVQGGAEVYSDALNSAMTAMDKAKTLDEYVEAAGKLQDFYAENTPAIALYWDNMIYAHSAGLKNMTIDATFGLNNVNTWFTIEK